MSEKLKTQLVYEIAEELIKKFDKDTVNEVVNVINKHLYNYDIIKPSTEIACVDETSIKMIKLFIGTKKLEGLSENTLHMYYLVMKALLNFLNKPIVQINTMDIKFYLMSKKENDHVQNVSLENYRACLSAVFSWLAQEEMVPVNPCAKIARIKTEQKIRLAFTAAEMNKIREAAKNKKDRAIVEFLYSTGCRVSEVAALNIDNIDFENKEVVVHGKGNKNRKVYLSDLAIDVLKKYLDSRTDENPALFLNYRHTRLTDSGYRRILKSLEPICGVENIHPHRFRRTLATDLLNEDVNIQDVAKLLGHANVRVTQKYYDHKDAKVKKEFFEVINK